VRGFRSSAEAARLESSCAVHTMRRGPGGTEQDVDASGKASYHLAGMSWSRPSTAVSLPSHPATRSRLDHPYVAWARAISIRHQRPAELFDHHAPYPFHMGSSEWSSETPLAVVTGGSASPRDAQPCSVASPSPPRNGAGEPQQREAMQLVNGQWLMSWPRRLARRFLHRPPPAFNDCTYANSTITALRRDPCWSCSRLHRAAGSRAADPRAGLVLNRDPAGRSATALSQPKSFTLTPLCHIGLVERELVIAGVRCVRTCLPFGGPLIDPDVEAVTPLRRRGELE